MHTGLPGLRPGYFASSRSGERVPRLALRCACAGLLRLALRRGCLAPQGHNRPQVIQRMACHDLPPTMPVKTPTKDAVAHPPLLHRRDNAGHPKGEVRLGIRPTQGEAPVRTMQELLGRPGLRRRQPMLRAEVSDRGSVRCPPLSVLAR